MAIVNPLAALDYKDKGVVTRPFLPTIKHYGYLVLHPSRQEDRMISKFAASVREVIRSDLAAILGQSVDPA